MTHAPLKQVTIYTDGGAIPNPGRGGYGVVLRFGTNCKELSGGYRLTTNNRMELMAVIAGLEALKERCHVTLHSDSQYIVERIKNGSAFKWRANDFYMNSSRTKLAKNADLWERLLAAYDRHKVDFVWVKGHAGIEDNERCDRLAADAMSQRDLPDDAGYLASNPISDPYTDSNFSESGSQNGSPESRPFKPNDNTKMTEVGQPCRKCGTPIEKRATKKKQTKPGQSYYYEWYLYCPGCKSMYLVEEAKRFV